MKEPVLHITSLSKEYNLGAITTGTLAGDLSSVYAQYMGKEDPNSLISSSSSSKSLADKKILALKDLNLEVYKGDILGIIGKNGAGKSTLLKIISRITAPSVGEIKIKGRLSSLLEVGTGFHPELTGKENIFLNGAILGMNRNEIKSKLGDIVEFSGIKRYLNTPVKRYSSGMKVRLAFSVAAHLDAEILVVDEVLAVGDASFQEKCLNKMNSISKKGRTILFVSHQLNWINELCNRCILIEKGSINMDGKPSEVIKKYLEKPYKVQSTGSLEYPSKLSDNNTGEIEIQKIKLIGEDNKIKNEFCFKEKITVELLIKVNNDLENCHVFVMIGDLRGKIIIYSDSGAIGSFKGKIKRMSHKSVSSFQTNLLPGNFSIYLGVGKENGKTLEWLERVVDFKVLKVGKDPKSNFKWDTVHGSVIDDSIWSIEEK